mmetsp:Transcript_28075/g.71555  ORF Transcript_28075/g.71555 Transcript_28075/m.71555 type:complete len:215 (-) Transcript_28075:1430-2074(-)
MATSCPHSQPLRPAPCTAAPSRARQRQQRAVELVEAEGLQVELQRGHGHGDVELGQHLWVHDAKRAHLAPLAVHPGLPPREERRVVRRLPAVRAAKARLRCLARPCQRHTQHLHHAVQQAVDDLKVGLLVGHHRHQPPLVARAHVLAVVQQHHVAHLKQLDGQRRVLVGAQRLERGGQQRGAAHLELSSGGVADLHGAAALAAPQVAGHLRLGA